MSLDSPLTKIKLLAMVPIWRTKFWDYDEEKKLEVMHDLKKLSNGEDMIYHTGYSDEFKREYYILRTMISIHKSLLFNKVLL